MRRRLTIRAFLPAAAFIMAYGLPAWCVDAPQKVPEPRVPFSPETYVIQRPAGPIVVDGRLSEDSWIKADWTEVFGDIEGSLKPRPRFRTRIR